MRSDDLDASGSGMLQRCNSVLESSDGTGGRWYVVQTQPHAEDRATENLERQGYRVFCPRIRKTVRHARKVKHIFAPLFSSYVFIQVDVSKGPWRRVNGTPGVSRLLTQGDSPLPVPFGVVEALRLRLLGDSRGNAMNSLRVGQSVRIAEGPFSDLVGTLEQLDSIGRARVLLDLLGQSVSVALRREALANAA